MKKVLNGLLGYVVALLCILWMLGILIIANSFIEWVCANSLRFIIVAIIGTIVIIRMIIKEIK